MANKTGKHLYWYTMRDGYMYSYKAVVTGFYGEKVVMFDSGYRTECPDNSEIGVVNSTDLSLWLTEQDNVLAKRLFVEHVEKCLDRQVKKVKKIADLLETVKRAELG